MSYVSQDTKKQIAELIKPILERYNVRGSLSAKNGTLRLLVKSGAIDWKGDTVGGVDTTDAYEVINTQKFDKFYKGQTLAFLNEIVPLLHFGNQHSFDYSDQMFRSRWYVDVRFGNYNKPYELVA